VIESAIFTGGPIFTGRHYCEALLVENGRVLLAGTAKETRRAAGRGTEIRDLHGMLLLPGLIDAHFHVADVTRSRVSLSLTALTTTAELVEALGQWATDHPSGLIVGQGYNPEANSDHEWVRREELDRAIPHRPTILRHVSGHALVANTAALAAAGFDSSTPDPPGGKLGRNSDRTLDGRVYEGAVRILESRLAIRELPDPEALRHTMEWAAAMGLTTLGAMSASPEEAVALRELARTGKLPGRVRVYLWGGRWEEYFQTPAGNQGPAGRFAVIGVKEYTDGAFGTRTAWLNEPYADNAGGSGMPTTDDARLRELLAALAERGLAPALHALGDRAIAYSLKLLETFPKGKGPPPRIEHAGLTPPELIGALARVKPVLVVQPGFVWSDHWLSARLGPARARWAYAFHSLTVQGLHLVGSSDAPYDPVDPWRGIRAAVHRTDPSGHSANPTPEEALSPEDAVALYTAHAGAAFGEPSLGVLDAGSPADFVIMKRPSLEEAVEAGSSAVVETWVAGALAAKGAGAFNPQTVKS
jgi:predicted amidohydrolase YtcJ